MSFVKEEVVNEERRAVSSAADYTIPIEDLAGLFASINDEPPRPKIMTVSDEFMRFVTEAQNK